VIVATGLADTTSTVDALHAGAEDYLTKPLDFEALLVSVQMAMNRRAEKVERQHLRARADELYEQAIAAVQAHEEVLSVVSHDLRNPLAVIAGSAQQLLRASSPTPGDILGSDVSSMASRILKGTVRMERLIADLLDQSRIRGGRLHLELAVHRVSELLADVSDLRPLAQQKQVLIEIQPPLRDRLVCCDRARMAQALGNLLANAIRFSPAGGTVSARATTSGSEPVVVSAFTRRLCAFDVWASGHPARRYAPCFVSFMTANSRARSKSGASLGLSVLLVGFLGAPASAQPQTPPCIRSWPEVRYRNYGYDHVVHIGNACRVKATCAVSSDVSPEWIRVIIPAGEALEVVTTRGSPAREFTPRIECRFLT
jgi:K+-sensing histidine kinase KdpD